MNFITRISAVLSETPVHRDTMSFKVLTEQLLSSPAVETLAAKLGIVRNNTFTNCESPNLRANGSDNPNGLMTFAKNSPS